MISRATTLLSYKSLKGKKFFLYFILKGRSNANCFRLISDKEECQVTGSKEKKFRNANSSRDKNKIREREGERGEREREESG